MKALTKILLFLICSSLFSRAHTKMSAEMMVCTEIQLSLGYEFINRQKELPVTWDDFEAIKMTKSGLLKYQSFRAKTINSFALVPEAPIIQPQAGMLARYQGHRLFMISRSVNFEEHSERGRYAILVKPQELDSKPARAYSYFISEDSAQIILKQLKDFDPQKQPLAFENIDQFERDKKTHQDQSAQLVAKQLEQDRERGSDDRFLSNNQKPYQNWNTKWRTGLILGFCVIVICWAILKLRK